MQESRARLLPLTAAQQGVWYAQLLDPQSPKYNIGECIEICGPLDEKTFETVLRRAGDECDSLNTEFVTEDDIVHQRITRKPPQRCGVVDLTGADDPVDAAERYMADDMAAVDSLTSPRHTLTLIKLRADLHYWYLRYHHIAMDGLSGSVFARRVAEMYTAAMRGEEPAGVEAPLSALIDDEIRYRRSAAFENDRAYWTKKFGDLSRPADGHPGGGPAGTVRTPGDSTLIPRRTSHRGAGSDATRGADSDGRPAAAGNHLHQGETLPPQVMAGLRSIAAGARTTWSAVYVSAVAAYLARITGCRDVVIGLASNGRHGSLRHIVGMTANILPLRIRVTPDMTVEQLVRTVATEMRLALRHRRYSREDLARDLNIADDASRLSDIVVNVMPYDYGLDFAGSPGASRLLSTGPVDDVSMFISERSEKDGPLIGFDVNQDLYHFDDVLPHQQGITTLITEFAQADLTSPLASLRTLDDSTTEAVLDWGRGGVLEVPDGVLGGGLFGGGVGGV
ncbi:condensation domain-containing protein, partial [Streptomyces sp. DT17]